MKAFLRLKEGGEEIGKESRVPNATRFCVGVTFRMCCAMVYYAKEIRALLSGAEFFQHVAYYYGFFLADCRMLQIHAENGQIMRAKGVFLYIMIGGSEYTQL